MIPQEEIEKVAAANDIVDVIGSYFPLKRAGTVYKALCPFHREKSPSFTVNPGRQIFKCFGCGAGGSVIRFVEMYESLSFPDAFRRMAARAGIRVEDEPLSAEEDAKLKLRRRLLSLHAEATEWFHRNLLRTRAAQHARDYLKNRGISAETARSWKLGYAPDSFSAFCAFARENKYSARELAASGLVTWKEETPERVYDRFRDRLMFPICNGQGETIAFSGRVLSAEAFGGKYVNSPETPLFSKGRVLFGMHKTKRPMIDARSAIVCEGQLDLITAFEAGVCNVTAPQGTAFTPDQARLLKQWGMEEVVLCFDADAAGLKAAERSLPALLDMGIAVRVAEMPAGHDPDSLIRQEGAEAFRQVISAAPDYFDFQIDHFTRSPDASAPRAKAAFARKIAESIVLITDPVLRSAVVNTVSGRLEVPQEQIAALLKRQRSAPRTEEDPEPLQKAPPLSPAIRLLCQLIVSCPEARAHFLAQPWEEVLSRLPDGELPARLLRGNHITPEGTVSLAALSPEDQATLAGVLDTSPLPANPGAIALECWRDLERRVIAQERAALTARMRQPGLSEAEVLRLQKQVLDLTQRHTHITRPLSPSP